MPLSFASLVTNIVGLFKTLMLFAVALALVFFLYGVFKFINSSGSVTNKKVGYSTIMWGLGALTVIFGIAGMVSLISSAILGT